ncbi:MAG: hypothetical protein ACR2NZ_08970 [Rubripirellula sp.]
MAIPCAVSAYLFLFLPDPTTYYMNDESIDPDENPESEQQLKSAKDPHADKYNDPRVSITPRGIGICVAVLILGAIGAAGSIYARKTKLEQTTRFWGDETITALQLAERIELLPIGSSDFKDVELTATPGLGHLRRALLDERGFDWTTETEGSAAEMCQPVKEDEPPSCVRLRLTDPTAHRVGTIEIDLDLAGGWVGPGDGSRRVRATEWVQPKLRNYFATIINVEQLRYDLRD